jgi:hypothetical protein
MPTAEDFRHELFRIFEAAQSSGSDFVEINAGALHRRLGGYPGIDSRMPDCCHVMKAQLALDNGDVVVNEPLSGQGGTLTVRYRLPRLEWRRPEVPREKLQSSLEKWSFKLRLWGSREGGGSPPVSKAQKPKRGVGSTQGSDMSEREVCVYCKKSIEPLDDTVKVFESARVARSFGEPIYQQYAHAACYEQKSRAKASTA